MLKNQRSLFIIVMLVLACGIVGFSSAFARTTAAPGGAVSAPPSGQDNKAGEGLGIPHSEKMILALTTPEQTKLKQIMKDKPVDEARSYVVTRYFLRTLKDNPKISEALLDAADRKNVQQYFDIDYCTDIREQLSAMNGLLYFGIEPAKGVEPKVKK